LALTCMGPIIWPKNDVAVEDLARNNIRACFYLGRLLRFAYTVNMR